MISKKDLADYTFEKEIVGKHGNTVNKSIIMVVNTTDPINKFKVTNNKLTVGTYVNIDIAIDVYNSL